MLPCFCFFRRLAQHPWIAPSVESIQSHGGNQGSAIIANLVGQHLPVLQSFREVSGEPTELTTDCLAADRAAFGRNYWHMATLHARARVGGSLRWISLP